MTGVEILAAREVATEYIYNWGGFWVIVGISLIVCTVIGIVVGVNYHNRSALGVFALVGLIWGALFGIAFVSITQTPLTYVTEYKVTVSDEVSMNEFCERYEVIGQGGKIFTVRERQ